MRVWNLIRSCQSLKFEITIAIFVSFSLFPTDDMIDVIGYNSDCDRSSSDLNNGSDGGLAVSSKEIIIQQF